MPVVSMAPPLPPWSSTCCFKRACRSLARIMPVGSDAVGVAIVAVASAGVSTVVLALWRRLQPLVLGTSCAIRRSGVESPENGWRAVRGVLAATIIRAADDRHWLWGRKKLKTAWLAAERH